MNKIDQAQKAAELLRKAIEKKFDKKVMVAWVVIQKKHIASGISVRDGLSAQDLAEMLLHINGKAYNLIEWENKK